jgi:hypothetical protein
VLCRNTPPVDREADAEAVEELDAAGGRLGAASLTKT